MRLRFILLLSLIFVCFSAANAQSGRKAKQKVEPQESAVTKKESEDRPLKIIKKTPPQVKVFVRCAREQGVSYVQIKLRVTFADTGKVSDVEVVNPSGCYIFDEEAIRVANLIKFQPEIKDGKPQTVTKTLIYEGGVR